MTKTSDASPLDTKLAVELWEVDKLIPYEKNAKLHPPEQVERLAATIKKFGWDQPIVVDADGVIIKGHGRRLAALHMGADRVPVLVRRDLSKSEADAVRISDNAVFSTQFDTRMLQEELGRLMAETDVSFSIDDLGLSSKDHDLLMKQIDVAAEEALMADASIEVEKQKDEDAERVEKSDREEVSLGDAFGFRKITREHARLVQRFVALTEDVTGKEGAEALVGWLEGKVAEGVI